MISAINSVSSASSHLPSTRRCIIKPSRAKASPTALNAVKLYTNPGSRGKIAEWILAELHVPYETVLLDMRKGEHKAPTYLAINPWGKVPAMEDGEGSTLACTPL